MLTGPVGPVEVIFYWPEAVFENFYWPGAIGSPLASSPVALSTVDCICGATQNDGKPLVECDIIATYGVTLTVILCLINDCA